MSAVRGPQLRHRSVLPDNALLCRAWPEQPARLVVRRLKSWVVVITAPGDIDATNADTLTEYTLEHATRCRGLTLDLRGMEFFGTEGVWALERIAVNCARAGTGWAVVPGGVVSRVLRICNPQGSLPAAETLDAALVTLEDQLDRPPQLTAVGMNPRYPSR